MSRKHQHGAHDEEHENAERWLLTYADMITLLMALFIVLYSMSVLNKSKFEAFQASLSSKKLTGQPDLAKPAPTPTVKPQPPTPTLTHAELYKIKAQLETALKKAHQQNAAHLVIDDKGLSIKLTSGVLFDSGEAVLLPNGVKVLDIIGPKLTGFDNPITIEGHTDNQPINTGPYPTNWELSTSRATTVLRFVLDTFRVEPARLSAVGYADTRPEASNATPSGRATNRRVVLLISAPATSAAAVPAASATPALSPTPSSSPSAHK